MTGWLLQAWSGDWLHAAACRGMDTDLWFPGQGERPHPLVLGTCAACPVTPECLDAGMAEEHGVWGGSTTAQRAAVMDRRRRERTADCVVCGAPVTGRRRVYCSEVCGAVGARAQKQKWEQTGRKPG